MTPMINGIERLKRGFNAVGDLRIGEATEELMSPECEPNKAAKYAEYINASFEHVKKVNADAGEDMKIVMSQARQIKAILTDQEKFANVAQYLGRRIGFARLERLREQRLSCLMDLGREDIELSGQQTDLIVAGQIEVR